MKTTTSLLTTGSIILALMGQGALGSCFDVKAFGAVGDGVTDDTASIQAAINAAGIAPNQVVCFPAGTYRVIQAIRPEYDHLTLKGVAGATIVADPDMSTSVGMTAPEAILVSKGFPVSPTSPSQVVGLTIESLAVQAKAGFPMGNTSAGAIQLNYCVNCLVSNVTITYTGSTLAPPADLDGLVTSQGTTGKIQGVVVSGIPKAGIYLAGGKHDLIVDKCEVKNTRGPIDQAGISIDGAKNVTVMRSTSHDNGGPGMLISVQDANQTTNIVVESSQFNNNGGEGITFSSIVVGQVPTHVAIVGVQAVNNNSHGIWVQAGKDVTIDGAEVARNGIGGIRVENTPIDLGYTLRTSVVQITFPKVYDNGRLVGIPESGIGLVGVQQVSIIGGHVYSTGLSPHQVYGIGLYRNKFLLASDQVTIVGVVVNAVGGLQWPPVVTITESGSSDSFAAVQHGYYNLSANGPPEGVLAAPAGSFYQDLSGHALYTKASGWGPTGWVLF